MRHMKATANGVSIVSEVMKTKIVTLPAKGLTIRELGKSRWRWYFSDNS